MEIWKDIKGYEGLYQVSNLGKVKSIEKDIIRVRNGKEIITHIPEKILFQMEKLKRIFILNCYRFLNRVESFIRLHSL